MSARNAGKLSRLPGKQDWLGMDVHPAQQLFVALMRCEGASVKSEFSGGGVVSDWNLNQNKVSGSFTIYIKKQVDLETGQYVITAEDFLIEQRAGQTERL